ncbi:MAG: hypothetical protein QOG43_2871 [Actinomycetota bacterium]|nr:hypothetical protein [Actinomycetota bacterium]
MACRFPGGASSPDQFWDLLREGRDVIGEWPADRWDASRVYDPDPASPGTVYVNRGGAIDDPGAFDAAFFAMSPREAIHVDPQHRLLLELAYEALEDGGLPLATVAGTDTGVFVGISTHDYGDVQVYPHNRALIDGHSNSGAATSLAANRISYMFDLRGPSMIVDTACSSSLTAVHLAVGALRRGECGVALAGGVQLVLAPELTIGFCKASMLSPDGRCAAFDASANGYVRSEGGGVVVLKPLDRAVADGDRIYAVVAGTAVNQDGHTMGMTVPSPAAQEAVVRAALADAGIEPAAVGYVEAHGTGTPVGDPIEAAALGAVFGPALGADADVDGLGRRCAIGSAKTNVGHLEAASGMVGLCKAALSVQRGQVPASLHLSTPNPAIDFDGLRLRVVTELEPWPGPEPRVAGVNSFGFGGANAHVVVTEAPTATVPAAAPAPAPGTGAPPPAPRQTLLPVSARTPEALAANVRALADHPTDDLDEVCRTAARRRSHHDYRWAGVAATAAEMADLLDASAAGERRAAAARGRAVTGGGPPVAFVFSGMGPQWWGMARQLLTDEPVFASVVHRCEQALRAVTTWSLLAELQQDESRSRVAEADLAQVTNFAVQMGLVALWEQWGVRPAAVIGHSAGEIAASCTAGALTLEEAVVLAWHRSRLQSRATGEGGMLAVGLPVDELEAVLADRADVCVAAVNGPAAVTLSGTEEGLAAVADELTQRQVFARFLKVAVPYHSPHMDPIRDEIVACLADLRPRPVTVPMVSVVTAGWVTGDDLDASYWWRAIRRPVLFAGGLDRLVEAGHRTFVEISPHPVLGQSIAECLAAHGAQAEATVLPSIRRKEDDRATMLRSAGALWTLGVPLDWAAILGDGPDHARLPPYQWSRERHWFESRPVEAGAADEGDVGRTDHPLLGRRIPGATPLWQVNLGRPGLGWLRHHVVRGTAIHPAAAYLETALAAARVLGEATPAVRDMTIPRALVLGGDGRAQCSVTGGVVAVHAADGVDDGWELHAKGRLGPAGSRPPVVDTAAIHARCPVALDPHALYQGFRDRGLDYGDAFGGITAAWQGRGEAIGVVTLPAAAGADDGYLVHPALLDAAFQMLLAAADGGGRSRRQLFVPVRIDRVAAWATVGRTCRVHARMVDTGDEREVVGEVVLFDDDGRVLLAADGLHCRQLDDRPESTETVDDWLYELRWEPVADAGGPSVIAGVAASVLAPVVDGADRVSAEQDWDGYYRDVEPVLEQAAAGFLWQALVAAGWDPAAGPCPESGLAAATGTAAGRARLLAAAVDGLVGGGWLRREDGMVAATGLAPPPAPAKLLADLAAGSPAYATDAALLARCGAGLAGVLQGRLDAAQILFADEGADLLAHFYRDAPASRFSNTLVTEAVAALIPGRGGDRPLRVLEVGGGTGGTTAHVRRVLPDDAEYTFTDVSPRFTQAVTGVHTAVVDIERDLAAQGIEPGTFDLVVGANVVHATADAGATLSRLAGALAPGGRLVLVEITRALRWLDVVFGVTDGWWRFADLDTRPAHALLTPDRWRSVLKSAGFTDVTVVADHPPAGPPGQSVLVATWPGGVPAASASGGPRWSVSGPGPLADALRAALPGDDRPVAGIVHVAIGDGGGGGGGGGGADLLDRQLADAGELLDLTNALPEPLPAGVCVVTAGAQSAGGADECLDLARAPLWGLLRVAMKERPGVRWQLVDLPAAPTPADLAQLVRLLVTAGPAEDETAIRGGRRLVRRLRRLPPPPATSAAPTTRPATPADAWRADVLRPGALETCALRPVRRHRPGPGQVEIAVDAAGLNFRDVVLAMGLLPAMAFDGTFGEQALGLDLSGRVVAVGPAVGTGVGVDTLTVGDAVFGIGPGTIASHTTTAADLVTGRPPGLSPVDAAASPCAFVTALYALDRQARLLPGERVLIHSATGGVGLAAIQLARRAGAEILATAGSEAKRDLLRSMGIAHVFDSRGLDFGDEVLAATGGHGVDVVLNSLSGEAIARGISTLAPFGRFVELGKRDIYDDANLGLLAFRRNLSFFAVDLDRLCRERPRVAGELLRAVAALLADGSLEPLPAVTFPVAETGAALRFMGQARHTGKIVLDIAGAEPEIEAPVRRCRPDGTYLVTGGTGGFGLATAGWLVGQGAGTVVVVARRPPDKDAAATLAGLEADGARIVALTADVGDEDDVARVLDEIGRTLPPLRGVVHAAMVLEDATLGELDRRRLERNMHAKVLGAWHLHRLTAAAGADLDLFVCFSSIAALLGNAGQGGYAAANAFLQALAHHRQAAGLPGLTVDWGVLSDVGYVSRHPDLARHLDRHGYRSFPPADAFACLERLLDLGVPQGMAARVDWGRLAQAAPDEMRSSRLGHFTPVEGDDAPRGAATTALAHLLSLSGAERLPALVEILRTEVASVLGVSPTRVELDRPLPDLGFDSLIAVELAAVVQLRLGVELPLVRLLQDATVTRLATLVLDLVHDLPSTPPPAPAPATVPAAADVDRPPPEAPLSPSPPEAPTAPTAPTPPTLAPPVANGHRDRYETLDYRRWSPVQRAIKGTIGTALRAVASIEVDDGHHLDTPGPYILATNHLALVDVPLVLTVMPRPVIVLAAAEYRGHRITDWFLADMGHAIYVDRGSGDVDALEQALVVLRSGGVVGVSPEGRRSHTGTLERAHSGVAHLAARAGVPVVPMAVWGQEAIRATLRRGRRSPVRVRVGAPIPAPPASATPSELLGFTTRVMTAMAAMLPAPYRGVYAADVAAADADANADVNGSGA